jgi:hypothetical protein
MSEIEICLFPNDEAFIQNAVVLFAEIFGRDEPINQLMGVNAAEMQMLRYSLVSASSR